ncbi:pre-rRNA-processing protein TSR2 homolog [Narcine bancroftii]|uniref:pre-rRNA-processing protein TSR2 homolog n=1 Tax=Narcine bancroftii TaxID=1343680 RepID=UPI00383115BB
MAALRELFEESVKVAMEAWPAFQVVLENGFGGVYSQQKADWMVGALTQYFEDNASLERDEVEELLADMLDNEFNTVIEDGSVSEVAHHLWTTFAMCQRGEESRVRARLQQMAQGKAIAQAQAMGARGPGEDGEESPVEEEEVMECDDPPATSCPVAAGRSQGEEETAGDWTVVRRRRK